jgi:murein tripeptide amidase MpaA
MFPGKAHSETMFFKDSKYIVISARVHPSEVASSYVLQGIINKLFSSQRLKSTFLKDCVLLIVPMLNPDGVYNGYTRLDTNGYNLNAHYKYADHNTPTINALSTLIDIIDSKGQLYAYFDLHSHLTKRGVFFFGNPVNEENYEETLEIPYLFDKFEKDFTPNASSRYFF